MSTQLTPEQLAEYHERGFIVLPAVFNDEEVARLRGDANFILELILNSTIYHRRQSRRLDMCFDETGNHMVRKVQPVKDLALGIAEASADDRLLDPMRQIMGDEPILMEEKLNYKQPLNQVVESVGAARAASMFPIHNDWAYYADQDYPQSVLSSAISLDDCGPESGPIRVWPGTHKTHLKHEQVDIGLEVPSDLVDHAGGEDILAPAGSVMIFSSLVVHNSRNNVSGKPRRMMIYSHYPKAANMGHDVRNGPGRLHESPYEMAYMRAKANGEFEDAFTAPTN